MSTKRRIVLLLIIGLGSIILCLIFQAGYVKPGHILLALAGIALYASWKNRRYLSLETFETVCESYVLVAFLSPLFLLAGGALIVDNLKMGNDHSGLLIAVVVFGVGLSLIWKNRQAFSVKNIVYIAFLGIAMIGFWLCMIGGIGFLTGYTGFKSTIPLERWHAVQMVFVGLSVIGILALEIWLPDIDACIRNVLGKEPSKLTWSPF